MEDTVRRKLVNERNQASTGNTLSQASMQQNIYEEEFSMTIKLNWEELKKLLPRLAEAYTRRMRNIKTATDRESQENNVESKKGQCNTRNTVA